MTLLNHKKVFIFIVILLSLKIKQGLHELPPPLPPPISLVYSLSFVGMIENLKYICNFLNMVIGDRPM